MESCTLSDTLEIMLDGMLLIPASEDKTEVVTLKHLGIFDQEDPDESVVSTAHCEKNHKYYRILYFAGFLNGLIAETLFVNNAKILAGNSNRKLEY